MEGVKKSSYMAHESRMNHKVFYTNKVCMEQLGKLAIDSYVIVNNCSSYLIEVSTVGQNSPQFDNADA